MESVPASAGALLEQARHDLRALIDHVEGLHADNARLEFLASRDGLTGVLNHRSFMERLRAAWDFARRHGAPLCVVMVDLDDFRAYNNTFGHPAANEVLKSVAQTLEANVRSSDVVARYGGEEFALLLPHTGEEAARNLAERLCDLVAAGPWPQRSVTASFGLAVWAPADASHAPAAGSASGPDALVVAADQALLQAKARGKNRVVSLGHIAP